MLLNIKISYHCFSFLRVALQSMTILLGCTWDTEYYQLTNTEYYQLTKMKWCMFILLLTKGRVKTRLKWQCRTWLFPSEETWTSVLLTFIELHSNMLTTHIISKFSNFQQVRRVTSANKGSPKLLLDKDATWCCPPLELPSIWRSYTCGKKILPEATLK
jgi:hypothetical protein